MQTRRIVTVHQSLHRHSHMLGAERELVMMSALIAFLLAIGGMTKISIIASVIFWVTSIIALRKIAKKDPIFSKVFMRHAKQQDFYPAKTPVWINIEGFKVKK